MRPRARRRARRARRRHGDDTSRLLRAADDRRSAPTRPTSVLAPSTSARSSPCTSTTTRDFDARARPGRPRRAVRAHRLGLRPRPRRPSPGASEAPAVRGRQLLHQRQAHRRGRRPAALRRRPRVAAPTTRPARSSTCCAGRPRARSRRPSFRRPARATRTRPDPRPPHPWRDFAPLSPLRTPPAGCEEHLEGCALEMPACAPHRWGRRRVGWQLGQRGPAPRSTGP